MIQISPPLVATQKEFDEMTGILGDVLSEAWSRLDGGGRAQPKTVETPVVRG